MRGKLWFVGGAAVGFVLGARAGRETYDQISQSARRMWEHPTTQETAGMVQERATRAYAKGKETMGGKMGKAEHGEHGEELGKTGVDPVTGEVRRPQSTTF